MRTAEKIFTRCFISQRLFQKSYSPWRLIIFHLEPQKNIRNIFGKNLRRFRQQKALSQRGLHAICGIDHGMISRMENGEVNVTLNTMSILAIALGVKVYELLQGEETGMEIPIAKQEDTTGKETG